MNRLTMLVTADGEWVLDDSTEFRAALGDPKPDYDANAFAVKNLGFIKVQSVDNLVIEIELHPRNVEFPALLAVQQHLLLSEVKLFRIEIFRYGVALGDYLLLGADNRQAGRAVLPKADPAAE